MALEEMIRRRRDIPGTWAVITAVVCSILILPFGFGPPVYPIGWFIPLIFSPIPLVASTVPGALGLRFLVWFLLTLTALSIGTPAVLPWIFMGIASVVGVVSVVRERNRIEK